MANVTIDIPGIGNIEAKNAATESTLRELVNAIKGLQKTTAKGSGGAAGGGAAGGGGTASAPAKAAASLAGKLGGAAKAAVGFAGAAIGAVKAVGEFAGAMSAMIGDIANVEDSLRSAAGEIPLLGSFFAPIASAVEKSVGAFQKSTAAGATFGGSVNNMSRAASAAGMTLDKFASLISSNGEAMRLLGGTTEDGANRFAQLSKQMRTGGYMTGLNNLGFTTEEVNQGMAGYIKYLGQTGKIGGKSNAELAAGSAQYLKQMDLLAKVTGETRKEQEDARAKLLTDAQFQAKVANMGADAGEALANTINGLPPGLRDVAKDIITTGTATTKEAQDFSALMPKSAALMQKYAAITEKGGTITKQMQQELQNQMAAEGKEKKLQFRTQGQFNKDLAGTYVGITQAANIQVDGIKKATAAQEASKKTTDALAAASEASKRRLSELSNSFTMMLANSGMLDSLMSAFEMVAKFIQTIVFPAFQVLGSIIGFTISILSTILMPAFTAIGYVINQLIMPAFRAVGDFLLQHIVPLFSAAVAGISTYLAALGYLNASTIANTIATQARALWDSILAVKSGILAVSMGLLAGATALLASPLFLLVAGVTAAVGIFVALYRSGFTFSTTIEALKDNFGRLWLTLQDWMDGLLSMLPRALGGISDEEAKIRKEKRDAERKELDDKEKLRDTEREAKKKERGIDDSFAKKREERDKKFYTDKTARDTKASEPAGLDMSSPEATAVSFFTQQKSPLVKAEAAKKELENKKEEDEKRAVQKTINAEVEAGGGATKAANPELVEISKNMAELVKINKANARIMEKQLGVQESLSGDVWAYPAA